MNALERALAGGVEVPNPAYNSRTKIGKLQPKTIISTDYTKDPSLQMARAFARNASPIQYNLNQYNDEPFEDYNVYVNPIDTREDLERQRAENQSWIEQTGRALSQIGGELVLGTARSFVDIGDYIYQKASGQSDYSSALGESIRQAQEEWNKNNEIYQLEPGRFNLLDWGYLMGNMVTVGNILSLAIPGAGIAKGIGLTGKLLRVNKALSKITRAASMAGRGAGEAARFNPYRVNKVIGDVTELGLSAGISRIGENYMEAHDTYKNIKDNVLENLANMNEEERAEFNRRNPEFNGKSNEEIATDIAGEGADDVFTKDMWLMAFDMMQLRGISKMWKGASTIRGTAATRKAQEAAIRSITGEAVAPISRYKRFMNWAKDRDIRGYAESLTEAPEEMWQSATQNMALQEAQDKLKYNPDKKDYLDFLTDNDALESGFWGVAAGLIFKGVGEAVGAGVNKVQDLIYRRNNKDNYGNYNHRRQESIIDEYRVAEINSRAAAYNSLQNDLKVIESGYDPTSPLVDEKGNVLRDDSGNVLYQELQDDNIQRAKESRIRDFVTTLTMNAYDRGNLASLKEFFKQANVKDYLEKGGVDTSSINNIDAIIENQMNEVEQMYDYELNKVANNSINQDSVRMIARNNILNRLDSQKLRRESDEYLTIYNNLLSKINNEQDRQNLTEAESKIRARVFSDQYDKINKRIKELTPAKKKRNAGLSFNGYTSELETLRRRKRTLEMSYLGETTYTADTTKRFQEKLKQDRNNTITNLARKIDADVVDSYINHTLLDIYSKYRASDVLDTGEQIQNESRKQANFNEKFVEEEYKNAIKQLNNIINDSAINTKDLKDYFNALLNKDRDAIAASPLTRNQKTRINKAIRAYDIFNPTNSPISEYINRRIEREAIRRREAEGKTIDVATGKEVVSTPPPTGGSNRTTTTPTTTTATATATTTTTATATNTPRKGSDGEPEAAGANVGKEDEPQPDKDEEAALKTQAEEARKTLEEIKNKEKTINEAIGKEIAAISKDELAIRFSSENAANTIANIKARVFATHPELNDTIESMFNDQTVIIGHIMSNVDTLEAGMNIDYIRDFIGGINRYSTINLMTYGLLSEDNDDIDYAKLKNYLDEYIKLHNIIGNTQSYYLNINSFIKFIIKCSDNKLTNEQVVKIYHKVATALNNTDKLNKEGEQSIQFNFKNRFLPNINERIASNLIVTAINETNIGAREEAISSVLDDKRINIFGQHRIEAGDTIYYTLSPKKDKIYFYKNINGNYVLVGANTIAKKRSPEEGTNFGDSYYNNFDYEETISIRFQAINDTEVASTFDELIRNLFPINVDNPGENALRDSKYVTIFNKLSELYSKHISGELITDEDVKGLYDIPEVAQYLNNNRIFISGDNINKAIALSRFIFDTILGYDQTDSNYIILQSYENYKRRLFSNYKFTEELASRATQNGAVNKNTKGGNKIVPIKSNCSLTVATSSEGQLLIDNSPDSESGTLRERLVDFDSKVDKGEIGLMYLDDNNDMHFSNTPRTFNIPGYSNKGNLLLSVDNGSKMPTFVALEPELVNVDDGLGRAISDEICDLILKFQTDDSYSLQNLQADLGEIIGYKKLINLRLQIVNGNKLIISFNNSDKLADIEIGNIHNGSRQIRFKADDAGVRDTISRNDLKAQIDNVVSKTTYSLSFDYSNFGASINSKYVTKTDNSFEVNIGGQTFTSNNYIKFIADNGLALTPVVKRRVGNEYTNFTTQGTSSRGNRNVQVLYPMDSNMNKNVVSDSTLGNTYDNFLDNFSTSRNGERYIRTDDFINTYLPSFKEGFKGFSFNNNIRLLDRVYYSDRTDVDGIYNTAENKIYITQKAINSISKSNRYSTKNAEQELARLIIHENLHRILNNTNTGKKIIDNIDNIKSELEEIASTLNNLTPEQISQLTSTLGFNVEKSINDLLAVSGFNKDTNKFEGSIADIEEFIVETMTRPQFINLLNNIEVEGVEQNTKRTLWDRFIDWITNLFSIDVNNKSLFKKEINAISSVYRGRPPVRGGTTPTSSTSAETPTNEVTNGTNDNPKTDSKEKTDDKIENEEPSGTTEDGETPNKTEEEEEEVSQDDIDETAAELGLGGDDSIFNEPENDDNLDFSTINIDYNTTRSSINVPNIIALGDSVGLENRSNLIDSVYAGKLKIQC